MDKNAVAIEGLDALGFGFIEIGTVTPEPQPGNEQPRMWRHLEDRALRNAMGFNNDGSEVVAKRLKDLRSTKRGRSIVVGVNIGKNKWTTEEDAASDYRIAASRLAPYADYLVINVSSPNTPGLRDLQAVDSLRPIIAAVRDTAAEVVETPRSTLGHVPLLVKLAPDLADDDVREAVDLAVVEGVDGLVLTNTIIDRGVLTGADRAVAEAEAGGISGRPLAQRSMEVLRLVRAHLDAHHPESTMALVSAGGVGDARDVSARLGAGADLVQAYSGLIYGGPFWPGSLVRGSRTH